MNRAIFLIPLALIACGENNEGTDTDTHEPVDTDTTDTETTETDPVDTDTTPPVDPCTVSGNVCVVVGIPEIAQFAPDGLKGTKSPLYLVVDVEFGPDGTMYIIDFNNHRIRKMGADGLVQSVTGSGMLGDGPEGPALAAAWNHPTSMAFNPLDDNTLYVAAWHNSRINAVNLSAKTLDWWAGTGARSYIDGVPRETAAFDLPSGLVFDDSGELWITDQANQLIRHVLADGTVTTVAGTKGVAGYDGDSGPAASALFHASVGQAADPSSRMVFHEGNMYFVDTDNNVVRMLDPVAGTISKVAGTYIENPLDATPGNSLTDDKNAVGGFSGDGGPAMDAQLNGPRDLAFGIDGELYIADTKNNCIRVVDTNGNINTFAGTCDKAFACGDLVVGEYGGDGGPAVDAMFCQPYGVAVDVHGDVFVSDSLNHVVRKITH